MRLHMRSVPPHCYFGPKVEGEITRYDVVRDKEDGGKVKTYAIPKDGERIFVGYDDLCDKVSELQKRAEEFLNEKTMLR